MNGRRSLLTFAVASALCACVGGQTGSEGYNEAVRAPGVNPPPNVECAVDADCHTRLLKLTTSLQQASGSRQLTGASCVQTTACAGPATRSCMCSFARAGSTTEEHLQLNGQCALFGRSLSCLLPAAELSACTPGTCDCAEQCRRAFDLLAADDARAVQVRERAARCERGSCKYVVDIDGHCYAGALPSTSTTSRELDCAQSDAALLAAGTAVTTSPAGSNAGVVQQCGVAGANGSAPVADKPLAECSSQALEGSL
jgi:hypothetical protein